MKNSLIISIVACLIAVIGVILVFVCLPSDGKDGADGVTPTIEISEDGYWVINGVKTEVIAESKENMIGLDFFLQDDGTYFVGAGNAKDLSNIEIPSTYKGIAVTGITNNAFYNCDALTSIVIPDSVTSIGDEAFRDCSSLTSIEIPDSVTSIGSAAFSGCSSLESITLPFVGGSVDATSASSSTLFGYIFGRSISTGGTETEQYYGSSYSYYYYIPSTLTTVTITGGDLYYGAFYNCNNITTITLGDSVTSVGEYAFYNCTGLTSIEIPDSVTSIGNSAFASCDALTSITIPDSVTNIGGHAFAGCTSLTSINYSGTKEQWGDIDKGYFWAYYSGNFTVYCTDGNISI